MYIQIHVLLSALIVHAERPLLWGEDIAIIRLLAGLDVDLKALEIRESISPVYLLIH